MKINHPTICTRHLYLLTPSTTQIDWCPSSSRFPAVLYEPPNDSILLPLSWHYYFFILNILVYLTSFWALQSPRILEIHRGLCEFLNDTACKKWFILYIHIFLNKYWNWNWNWNWLLTLLLVNIVTSQKWREWRKSYKK